MWWYRLGDPGISFWSGDGEWDVFPIEEPSCVALYLYRLEHPRVITEIEDARVKYDRLHTFPWTPRTHETFSLEDRLLIRTLFWILSSDGTDKPTLHADVILIVVGLCVKDTSDLDDLCLLV